MNTIVVGIDGSDASKAALEWALAEADLRGDSVRAVHAWAMPYVAYGYPGWTVDPEDFHAAAQATLDQTVAAAVGEENGDVEVESKLVEGLTAETLLAEAADADLLVVGSRGHGGFAGLLLGSVSHQCAQHAGCPVVIIRAPGS